MSEAAKAPRNPVPTVDVIIELAAPGGSRVVLIERANPPHGWALPGGFVDYGESAERAAVREAREETSLDVELVELFHLYSDPDRDPRLHTISGVYIARPLDSDAESRVEGADDAARAAIFSPQALPTMCFDHGRILADYRRYRESGTRPAPR